MLDRSSIVKPFLPNENEKPLQLVGVQGDICHSLCIYGNYNAPTVESGVMSTGILALSVPNGYVIGADGRRLDAASKTILTECAQKIFRVQDQQRVLAVAFAGATHLSIGQRTFSFADACKASASEVRHKPPSSYYESLFDLMQSRLIEVKGGNQLSGNLD